VFRRYGRRGVESPFDHLRRDAVAVPHPAGTRFENLALRQQVAVLIRTRGSRRLRLEVWDRAFWVMLSQGWKCWREALAIVEPATVIRWHREGFRGFWRRKSRPGRVGRPGLDREVVKLIQRMAQANVT